MKFTNSSSSGLFEQPPIGSHVARCFKVIDIGTQKNEWDGKVTIKRQVIIGWELPAELMAEGEYAGKPFTVSKFYTASLNEKATLRADLENWRGRQFSEQELMGFESRNVLGKPCMLSIIHTEKGKARVSGVMAMPRGMTVPDQINPSLYFSLDEFDATVFAALSDGYKKLIQASPEYQEIARGPRETSDNGGGSFNDFSDGIPF